MLNGVSFHFINFILLCRIQIQHNFLLRCAALGLLTHVASLLEVTAPSCWFGVSLWLPDRLHMLTVVTGRNLILGPLFSRSFWSFNNKIYRRPYCKKMTAQLWRAEKKVQDAFQCNNDGLLLQTKKQKYNLSHLHLWFLWDINHSKTYIQIQNNWSETPQNKYKMQWKQQQTTAPRNTCKIN